MVACGSYVIMSIEDQSQKLVNLLEEYNASKNSDGGNIRQEKAKEESIEFLEKTLSRLLEWIRSADSKITPVLAISTSMLGVMAVLVPKVSSWNFLAMLVGILTVAPLLICVLFLFLACFPRTDGPVDSLVYFETIKALDHKAYLSKIKQMTTEEYSIDLAKQCHRNAEIASSKYFRLKIAIGSLFLSIIPWIMFVFILYRE